MLCFAASFSLIFIAWKLDIIVLLWYAYSIAGYGANYDNPDLTEGEKVFVGVYYPLLTIMYLIKTGMYYFSERNNIKLLTNNKKLASKFQTKNQAEETATKFKLKEYKIENFK